MKNSSSVQLNEFSQNEHAVPFKKKKWHRLGKIFAKHVSGKGFELEYLRTLTIRQPCQKMDKGFLHTFHQGYMNS